MRTPKGQSGPTPLSSIGVNGQTVSYSVPASDEATDAAPARLIHVTRQGVSVNLPAAFWPRLAIYVIGLACLAGGYILMNVAIEYDDDDDNNE